MGVSIILMNIGACEMFSSFFSVDDDGGAMGTLWDLGMRDDCSWCVLYLS